MLRSLRWGGTDPNIYGATGGKYVHTAHGGGGSQDFQIPEEDPLTWWEGNSEFEKNALDVDVHPTVNVYRGSGEQHIVEHTILLRHHRYPNMYVHPLACSPTSGSHVCQDAVTPLQTPPTGTSLVFNAGIRGADDDPSRNKWDELGFQIILNPYESFSGMRARACHATILFFSQPQLFYFLSDALSLSHSSQATGASRRACAPTTRRTACPSSSR